jgi:hypothetical protein
MSEGFKTKSVKSYCVHVPSFAFALSHELLTLAMDVVESVDHRQNHR